MTEAVVLFVVAGLAAVVALAAGAGVLGGRAAPVLVGGGLLVAVLVAAAGTIFLVVLGDAALDTADLPVLAWLVEHRTPGRTATAQVLSLVGGTVGTGGLAVVAAVVLLVRGERARALIWVLGVAAGSLAIRLLKLAVERPRPPLATRLAVETSTSLPSGHSLMAALGLGLTAAAVVVLTTGRQAAARVVAVVLAVVLALAIGTSRAYLGVHWTTDVVSGWLLGAALAAACVTAGRVVDRRRADPTGPRSSPNVSRSTGSL